MYVCALEKGLAGSLTPESISHLCVLWDGVWADLAAVEESGILDMLSNALLL